MKTCRMCHEETRLFTVQETKTKVLERDICERCGNWIINNNSDTDLNVPEC